MKIGLLPLYLKLYDEVVPDKRTTFEKFIEQIKAKLNTNGLEIITAPICRLNNEFLKAIQIFEKNNVLAILTLHLAYSPSLESIKALKKTKLPIVVFDTTQDFDFSWEQSPDAIMYNHGIHGVQDMCNLLVRAGKPFLIEAGHWQDETTIQNVLSKIRSAKLAYTIQNTKAGLIGKPFKGMGDFSVPLNTLKEMGITVTTASSEELIAIQKTIDKAEIEQELSLMKQNYNVQSDAAEFLPHSIQTGLTIRKWLESKHLDAFSINFEYAGRLKGLKLMPFLEISLAMSRGIGYAGEGDILTASLVGALLKNYPETTFTEMFCPDWKNGRVFLSHMGEWNLNLSHNKPTIKKYPFIFGKGIDTVRALGCLKEGEATLVNLAPISDNNFRLITATGTMEVPPSTDKMADTVHGWFKPHMPLKDFLAAYSEVGGTHHSALVYSDITEELKNFAKLMKWDVACL